jgi:hypothetical protein
MVYDVSETIDVPVYGEIKDIFPLLVAPVFAPPPVPGVEGPEISFEQPKNA